MADNTNELGLDTTKAIQSILNLNNAFDQYIDRLDKISAVSVAYNKKGEAVRVGVTEIDTALGKLNVTFGKTKQGYRVLAASAAEAKKSHDSFLASLNKKSTIPVDDLVKNRNAARDETAGDAARKVLRSTLAGPNIGIASTGELRKFDGAIEKIATQVGKGKVSIEELNAAYHKATSGVDDLTGREERLVKMILAAKTAANDFGTESVKASNRAARASQAQFTAQQKVVNELEAARVKAYGSLVGNARNEAAATAQHIAGKEYASQLSSARPQQVIAFNNAMNTATKLIASGQVNLQQFQQTLNSIRAGTIQTGLPPALNTLQNSLLKANRAFEDLGATGEKSGKKIFLSMQNVVRIFEAQLLYSAFHKIQSGFAGSIEAAADYSKQIALIQTISQDAGLSTQQWATGIRQVSDDLGNPITDTATAAYDLLSNQVTKAADTFGVLDTAIQFARTTNSTATDSVNLLSSGLNSYALNADSADRVSRTFFTTIDLGRVTASELANSFGRTGTLAHSLGISLEETQAGITTLTRQGIKANEAYTLMNNVFIKLIKPTEAMQGWLEKMGYASGQDAIAALGLAGVLAKLSDEFDGSTAKAAKFFDEQRGERGVLNLTGKNLQQYTKDLQELQNSTGKYDIAKQLVAGTEGQKLTEEINKIKNFFIQDVGGEFLQKILLLTDKFGGLSSSVITVVKLLKQMAVVGLAAFAVSKVVGMVSAVSSLAGTIATATAGMNAAAAAGVAFGLKWSAGLAIATSGLSLIAAAFAIPIIYNLSIDDARGKLRELEQTHRDNIKKMLADEKEFSDKRQQLTEGTINRIKQLYLQQSADVRISLNKMADSAKEAGEKIAESLDARFNTLKSSISKAATNMAQQAKTAADAVADAQHSARQALNDTRNNIFEHQFSRASENGNTYRAVDLAQSRIAQLRKEGLSAARSGDVKSVNEAFDAQLQIVGKLASLKDQAGQYVLQEGQAEGLYQQILSRRLTLLKSIARASAAQAVADQRKAADQKIALEKLEDAYKSLKEFSPYDKKGNLKDEYASPGGSKKVLDELQKRQDAVTSQLKAAGADVPAQILSKQNFAKQLADVESEMRAQRGNFAKQLDVTDQLQALLDKEGLIKEKFDQTVASAAQIKGEIDKANASAGKFLVNIKTGVDAMRLAIDEFGTLINNEGTSKSSLKAELDEIEKFVNSGGNLEEAQSRLDSFSKKIGSTRATGDSNLLDNVIVPANPKDKDSKAVTVASTISGLKKDLADLNRANEDARTGYAAYGQVTKQIDELAEKLGVIPPKLKDTGTAASEAGTSISQSVQASITAYGELTAAIEQAVQEQAKLKNLGGGSGTVEKKSKGGTVGYYANGGFVSDFLSGKYASGSDTIPAMLTRGEEVINARSAAKFRPLLRAINAGILPGSGSSGGNGNITVGDINITVPGAPTSQQSIKQIGDGLRRGIRQKTISLY